MKTLLVIEDDIGIQKQLKWSLPDYELVFAQDRSSALTQLRRYEPEVVTLDLGLPPDPANATEGLACLSEILSMQPNCKVIVITGSNDLYLGAIQPQQPDGTTSSTKNYSPTLPIIILVTDTI